MVSDFLPGSKQANARTRKHTHTHTHTHTRRLCVIMREYIILQYIILQYIHMFLNGDWRPREDRGHLTLAVTMSSVNVGQYAIYTRQRRLNL